MSSTTTEHDFCNFHLCITSEKWRKGRSESIVVEAVEIIKKVSELQHMNVRDFSLSGDKIFIQGYLPASYPIEEQVEDLKKCFREGQRTFIEMNVEKMGIKNPFFWYRLCGTLTETIDWIDLQKSFNVKLETLNQPGRFLAVDGKRLITKPGETNDPKENNPALFTMTVKPAVKAVKAILMGCQGNYIDVDEQYQLRLLPQTPDEWFLYAEEGQRTSFKFNDKWLGVKGDAGKMVDEKYEYLQIVSPKREDNHQQCGK